MLTDGSDRHLSLHLRCPKGKHCADENGLDLVPYSPPHLHFLCLQSPQISLLNDSDSSWNTHFLMLLSHWKKKKKTRLSCFRKPHLNSMNLAKLWCVLLLPESTEPLCCAEKHQAWSDTFVQVHQAVLAVSNSYPTQSSFKDPHGCILLCKDFSIPPLSLILLS